eukprot:3644541-Pleurochrysis_carterae.AAC.4
MSPTDATRHMHRRLHAGSTRLRALPSITADAPPALARGRHDGCDACTEANATRGYRTTVAGTNPRTPDA